MASSASSRVLSRRLFCARKIDGWEEEEEEANGAQRSQLNYSRLSISHARAPSKLSPVSRFLKVAGDREGLRKLTEDYVLKNRTGLFSTQSGDVAIM